MMANKPIGTMNERFRVVEGVLVLIKKENQVLMLLRKGKFDDGLYSLPGGCMEDGETVKEAAIREVKEEVNLNIKENEIDVISTFHRICPWGWQSVEFVVIANYFAGSPEIMEKDKSIDLQWFDIKKLPNNISPYAKKAIDNYINNKHFSEINY